MANHCFFKASSSVQLVGVFLGADQRVLDEKVGESGLSRLGLSEESEAVFHDIHEAEVSHLQLGEESINFFSLFLAALDASVCLPLLGTVARSVHP